MVLRDDRRSPSGRWGERSTLTVLTIVVSVGLLGLIIVAII